MLQIEKGQDIKQELLHRYKTILPDELIKIWEDNGLARLMGEYLKAVNPEDYQELLKETYFRGNISIPILVTAFGDIVTFEEGQYIGMVKYKNGNFVMLAKNFKRFIQNLGDDYFLEKYFRTPVRMFSLARICILIYAASVKISQSVCVLREMCRYPVKYYTYSFVMKIIHKVHKVLRTSVS